jgi:ADP-ribose pyrophosphatase YjhB (NUDIX family)
MYKIYINETPLFLLDEASAANWNHEGDERLLSRYNERPKSLLHHVDMLEKSRRWGALAIYHDDLARLWGDFLSFFQLVEAAGGVVVNPHEQVLFIFRRQYWDLPKGKIDAGESPQTAALREVREETGLVELLPGPLLGHTYHTYREGRRRRVLKRTYWYAMRTRQENLTPQSEEDIEWAGWLSIEEFFAQDRPAYRSILDVLRLYQAANPDVA